MSGRWWLLGAALALGGCHPAHGDLDIFWTFTGQNCATAGVGTVEVRLFDPAGNSIIDDSFACTQQGVSYRGLDVGTYGFDLLGFSPGGARLYEAAGNVVVRAGDTPVTIDLAVAQ